MKGTSEIRAMPHWMCKQSTETKRHGSDVAQSQCVHEQYYIDSQAFAHLFKFIANMHSAAYLSGICG